MTNEQAAEHIKFIAQQKSLYTLAEREALEKAVTALQHQPEPQTGNPTAQQCWDCQAKIHDVRVPICPLCHSTNLRPIYTTWVNDNQIEAK